MYKTINLILSIQIILLLSSCYRDSSFQIKDFEVVTLEFIQQPTAVKLGDILSPGIQVAIKSNGMLITSPITIALSFDARTDFFNATINGATSISAVTSNGIATFSNLTFADSYTTPADLTNAINKIKSSITEYQLTATALGISATSSKFSIFPNTPIYRSVGFNESSEMQSGTLGKLTINDAIATFEHAPTNYIGVGDVIEYTDNLATKRVAFIYGKASTTVFQVRDSNGASINPIANITSSTDWKIFRAYTSLANADIGSENVGLHADIINFDTWTDGKDLTASNQIWNISCYKSFQISYHDSTGVLFGGNWRTDNDSFVRIYTPNERNEVGISQRHQGVWDTGYTRTNRIDSAIHYSIIDGISIKYSGGMGEYDGMFEVGDYTVGGYGESHISNNFGHYT